MEIRIAGTINDSVVDGDGYRFTVFTQGCPHHCPGCHNPKTWPEDGGYLVDTEEILMTIRANPLLAGVTFSGGEPFNQPVPLTHLAQEVRALGLDVWCYTGYVLDLLLEMNDPDVDALLDEIDVLVDGPFVLAERDLTLRFRGSRNQRVIDMKATRERGEIVLKYDD